MYATRVAGTSQNVTSYEAAVKAVKSDLSAVAANIRSNPRLFRSPKTRSRVADALTKVSFPKKSGNVARTIAGIVPVAIAKA